MQNKIDKLIESLKLDLNLANELSSGLKKMLYEGFIIEGEIQIIEYLKSMVIQTATSIIIYTPQIIPELLHLISQMAYTKRKARFLVATHIDFSTYYEIIKKMKALGNIQFRNADIPIIYFYCIRDAAELFIGKSETNPEQSISINYKIDKFQKSLISEISTNFSNLTSPSKPQTINLERLKEKFRIKLGNVKTEDKKQKILKSMSKYGLIESDLYRK